jgi:hypothetical protein
LVNRNTEFLATGMQRNWQQGMQSFLFFQASPEKQKMKFAGKYSGFYGFRSMTELSHYLL